MRLDGREIELLLGLFDSEEAASVEEAEKRIGFESSAVPEAVSKSLEAERLAELEGEFGVPKRR